jgi:hypothetical protein
MSKVALLGQCGLVLDGHSMSTGFGNWSIPWTWADTAESYPLAVIDLLEERLRTKQEGGPTDLSALRRRFASMPLFTSLAQDLARERPTFQFLSSLVIYCDWDLFRSEMRSMVAQKLLDVARRSLEITLHNSLRAPYWLIEAAEAQPSRYYRMWGNSYNLQGILDGWQMGGVDGYAVHGHPMWKPILAIPNFRTVGSAYQASRLGKTPMLVTCWIPDEGSMGIIKHHGGWVLLLTTNMKDHSPSLLTDAGERMGCTYDRHHVTNIQGGGIIAMRFLPRRA